LLQCNSAHALPSEGTKLALTWCFTVDSGESDDESFLSLFLASVARRTIWPDGEREPKSNPGLIKKNKPRKVDERLARVVRIIVEQYDGDVKAFVESIMRA